MMKFRFFFLNVLYVCVARCWARSTTCPTWKRLCISVSIDLSYQNFEIKNIFFFLIFYFCIPDKKKCVFFFFFCKDVHRVCRF